MSALSHNSSRELPSEVAMPSKNSVFIFNMSVLFIQVCAVVLLIIIYVLTINLRSKKPESTDFYKFYKSAGFFLEGRNIYTPVPFTPPATYVEKLTEKGKASLTTLHPNLNSPLHTLSIMPLGMLPFRPAFWVWSCLSLLGAYGALVYVLQSSSQAKGIHDRLNLLILLLGYFPTWANIQLGQYGLILLGLILFLWLTSRDGRYRAAGLILGIAISLKIFFGLFLLFFAVRRQWRVLAWGMSVFLVANLLGLAIFGLATYKHHLAALTLGPLYINASWNASFSGFFTRIFGGAENIPLVNMPVLAYGLAYCLSLLLILGLIWVSWPHPHKLSRDRFDLGFSLCLVAMLLISPFGWIYYFPLLFIPAVVAWRASSKLPSRNAYKAMIAGAWILSSVPTLLINSEEMAMNEPLVWFTKAGCYFYGLLAFCFLLFMISRKLHLGEPRPTG